MLSLNGSSSQVYQASYVIPGTALVAGVNTFVINPANWDTVKNSRLYYPVNFLIDNRQPISIAATIFNIDARPLCDAFTATPNDYTIVYPLANPTVNHFRLQRLQGNLTIEFTTGLPTPSLNIIIYMLYSII